MNFWIFLGWWILGAVALYFILEDADFPDGWKVFISSTWPFGLPFLGIVLAIAVLSIKIRRLCK